MTLIKKSNAVVSAKLRVDLKNIGTIANSIQEFSKTLKEGGISKTNVRNISIEINKAASALVSLQDVAKGNAKRITIAGSNIKYTSDRLLAEERFSRKSLSDITDKKNMLRARFISVGCNDAIPVPTKKYYSAQEACRILTNVHDSKRMVVCEWISRGWIPISRSAMFSLLKEYLKGVEVEWKKMGRPPIVNSSLLKVKMEEHVISSGESLSKRAIGEILSEVVGNKAESNGLSRHVMPSPSKSTRHNYFSYAQQVNKDLFPRNKVLQKSDARYLSENSVRAMVSYLLGVAVAHFQIGEIDTNVVPSIEKATEGANFFFELIKNENAGMPMTPVYPWFISSGDDSTDFCFEGKAKEDAKLYLVDSSCDSNTRLHFSDNTGSTDGCRGVRFP